MLNCIYHGEPTSLRPLVIAHGLFGSARNWGVIAKRLSDERQVVAVDMRNHGGSPWSADHRYAPLAEDLRDVIASLGGAADLLGHSMGGKAAMALALTAPDLIGKLVVADIAPVGYGHSQSHLIAAMRRVDLASLTSRRDADAALARDVEDATTRAFLLQSLDVKAQHWRLNLDALELNMEAITGWPGLNGRFDRTVLFLAGKDSDYVAGEGRAAARALFPAARFVSIPGAGHWLHAEKPREFEETVRIFLRS